MAKEVLFEGLSKDAILNLPPEQIKQLVLTGEPILFSAGTARILGEFQRRENLLQITLAQIEGGGEGVLPALSQLIENYSRLQGLDGVEWIVHAVHCAKPNLKLKRVLERRGFVIKEIEGTTAYYQYQPVCGSD